MEFLILRDLNYGKSSSRENNLSLNNLSCMVESLEISDQKDELSEQKKLSWLRSQLIGSQMEFQSPFGNRRITYADHTASGRSLHFIEHYIINNVLPFYGNSHTSDSYVGQRTTKTMHEATDYVKKCLGGGKDDALIFCGSGTTAAIKRLQEVIGVTIPSIMREKVLEHMPVSGRWVVFVGPYEHHSNLLSWRQSLADVVEIGLDEDGLLEMEDLRTQLSLYRRTNRPMLGSFSACSNVTGIYTDTRALARCLHQFGAFVCFDFAASGPYVEIEMRSGKMDGYDAVFLSPHKFIGGPGSPGVLLMSKALYRLKSSPPSTCGGGTVHYVNGLDEKDTLYVGDIEAREDAGTPPIIQKVRAALAFWVKEYIGYNVIEKQEEMYIQMAFKRLVPNPKIQILGNVKARRLAILSFLIYTSEINDCISADKKWEKVCMCREIGEKKNKPMNGSFVAKLLNDLFGIQARGGCACAGPYGHSLLHVKEPLSLAIRSTIHKGYNGVKPGWTRISFPFYMCAEEFEFILRALEFISIYGQRFLSIYNINWETGAWNFSSRALKKVLKLNQGSCNVCNSPIASMMQILEFNNNNNDADDVGAMNKFASYLDIAKRVADLLPKFPPQRKIPKEIDSSILSFRV